MYNVLYEIGSSVVNNSCDEHWNLESSAAGNPVGTSFTFSKASTASSILVVVIRCLSKVLLLISYCLIVNAFVQHLNVIRHLIIQMFATQEDICEHNFSTLRKLLSAFCTLDSGDEFLLDLQPPPPKDSLEYAFCSVYSYLDKLFDAGRLCEICFVCFNP